MGRKKYLFPRKGETHIQLFRRMIEKKENGCWEFSGRRNRDGYGCFSAGRLGGFFAHRFSWILEFGPIPPGLFVLHTCDNPPCMNPDHLFLGTRRDNKLDCMRKGRDFTPFVKGHKLAPAKLKEIDREWIITRRGTHPKVLGEEYGVTDTAIRAVWKTYRKEYRGTIFSEFCEDVNFLSERLGTKGITETVLKAVLLQYEQEKKLEKAKA